MTILRCPGPRGVLTVLAVCLCLTCNAPMVLAQPGGVTVSQLKKGPDLVIREIMLTGVKKGPVGANLEVQVGVMNEGNGQANGFNLALIYMSNLDTDAPYLKIEMKQVSGIMAGDGLAVHFVIPAHPGTPEQGMLIAVADPPVVDHASGAMSEGPALVLMSVTGAKGRTDLNNVFGVVFDATNHTMPLTWVNPATQ